MNKSTIINLSNIAFYLDDDAYFLLNTYLEKIKEYFKDYEDKEEIVGDIENRFAEKFTSLNKNPKHIISKDVVEKIIKEMGETDEFLIDNEEIKNSSKQNDNESELKSKKKLFLDSENKIIGGVASGVSAYTGINADIIRIIFVITAIIPTFPGLWIYIILLFVVPSTKGITDRVEMTGKALTLENIGKAATDKINELKPKSSALRKMLLAPFVFIGVIFEYFKKFSKHILTKVIGVGAVGISMIAFIGVSVIAVMILTQSNSPLIDTPIKNFPNGITEKLTVISIYLSVIIPILCILMSGVFLYKRKVLLKTWGVFSIIFIWMFSIISSITLSFNIAPRIKEEVDKAINQEKIIEADNFENIKIDSTNKIYSLNIKYGPKAQVKVKGNSEVVDLKVQNNTLLISDIHKEDRVCIVCIDYARLEITLPDLKEISRVSNFVGLNSIKIENFNNLKELKLDYPAYYEIKNSKAEKVFVSSTVYGLTAGTFEVKEANFEFDKLRYSDYVINATDKINVKSNISELEKERYNSGYYRHSYRDDEEKYTDQIIILYKSSPEINGDKEKDYILVKKDENSFPTF